MQRPVLSLLATAVAVGFTSVSYAAPVRFDVPAQSLATAPRYRMFSFRNSQMTGMISLPWVSSAKCPVS